MGGDNGQSKQNAITDQGLATQRQYLDLATKQLGKQEALTAPLEQRNTAIIDAAKTGDYNTLIGAASPFIGNITSTNKQATEAIYDAVPAGAGRDYAIAAAKRGQGTDVSTALNQIITQALTGQAQLGQQAGQLGLQETGAGISSLDTASQSNQALMQAKQQQKASQMGVIGSIAGAGGMALGGGFSKGGIWNKG
jgi:hypothetical protein